MNHRVPYFEMDNDHDNYPNNIFPTSNKPSSTIPGEEIMELVWQNGKVVAQSQNQRPLRNNSAQEETATLTAPLFMQEDEMATWLHYDDSSFERDLDLLYSTPPTSTVTTAAPPPAGDIHTSTAADGQFANRLQNFGHFSSRLLPRARAISTDVVDSNETPIEAVAPESRVSRVSDSVVPVSNGSTDGGRTTTASGNTTTAAGTSGGTEMTPAREFTMASSTSGSGASVNASTEPPPPEMKEAVPAEDRKRKGRETTEDDDGQTEVIKKLLLHFVACQGDEDIA